MFTHILIPIDDDPGSRRAIAMGVALAQSVGARVTGFHAMTEFAQHGSVDEMLQPSAEDLQALARLRAARLLVSLRRKAEPVGVSCAALVEQADLPWKAIVAATRESRCDLIVMASRGRRGIARLLLGSQTQQVLAHTGVPVLVVR